ncbi:beta-ketoacyl-ACP synthase II [Sporichthya polymorpha]|uniref:beta-ketoacyl-ACP synthase II n=1 Tax=Sporichthya polymorpha TaxID=35751 RepID=UPI0003613864|nr:beta-ketoacyl-ACP synthase II [Sporichthya polymorpha]
MSTRTVVVTGVGATTPLGGDARTTWSALLAGRSGVRSLTEEWAADLPVQIAARVAVDPSEVMDRVQARRLDRGGQMAVIAARDAWADAGGDDVGVEPERLGVVVASGIGGITTLLSAYDTLNAKGARFVSPLAIPMLMPNGPAAAIGLERTARAGVHTPVSACASGAEAIAMGADMIREGRADVVLAGGTEACIHPLPMAAFAAMKAMSTRNDEPERASRPYDKARDGFVLGEGSGVIVLESEEHARARGARIYCAVAGAGMSSDAHHIAQPEPDGAGVTRALQFALENSGITASDLKHVNAHATSTPLGDVAEILALRKVFGSALDSVAVSATKSMTGHLLGAAGAVEGVATVLAVAERKAPPTINVDDPDDDADIDIVRVEPRELPSGPIAALNNSFGFGGHNICVVFTSV